MKLRDLEKWDGRTYYGRPQVKPAPFDVPLVGGYIFLAGLSGGAQVLATLFDLADREGARNVVRRGRYISLLAPTIGAALLIADLQFPKRFYNMLRIGKVTSPMSVGSWILTGFGVASAVTAAMQWGADHLPGARLWRWLGSVTQIPAACAGAGLCTYTASLLSSTSTPTWATAPQALGVRFAASAIASAAAALGLGERHALAGRHLDSIAVAALSAELAALIATEDRYQAEGLPVASKTRESDVVTLGGNVLPMGLLGASLLLTRSRSVTLSGLASVAVLAGSLIMRTEVLSEGKESARDARTALQFAQPRTRPI